MEFHPAFPLLLKFSVGLPPTPKSEEDVIAVARYLGVTLADTNLDARIETLVKELKSQNGFLSTYLQSATIFESDEYRGSLFIREIVANNRINLQNRSKRDR